MFIAPSPTLSFPWVVGGGRHCTVSPIPLISGESRGRKIRRVDMRKRRIGRPAKKKRGRQLRRGGRSLDSKPALPRAPEEAGRASIEAVDRKPVGREGPEPRPASLDPLDRPVDDAFEAVDRGRDVDLVGRRVAWLGRDFVMRAEPDRPVALAFEIESPGRNRRSVANPSAPSGRRGAGPWFGAWARSRAVERPHASATRSAQAPAASTRIAQAERPPSASCTDQRLPLKRRVDQCRIAADLASGALEHAQISGVQARQRRCRRSPARTRLCVQRSRIPGTIRSSSPRAIRLAATDRGIRASLHRKDGRLRAGARNPRPEKSAGGRSRNGPDAIVSSATCGPP